MKEFKMSNQKCECVEVGETETRLVLRVRVTPYPGCDEITYGWFLDVEKESGNYDVSLGRFTSGYAPHEWDMYSRDTRIDVHAIVPRERLDKIKDVVRAFVEFTHSTNEDDYYIVVRKMKEVRK